MALLHRNPALFCCVFWLHYYNYLKCCSAKFPLYALCRCLCIYAVAYNQTTQRIMFQFNLRLPQVPTGHLIEVVFLDVVNNCIRYEVLDTLPSSKTTPGKCRQHYSYTGEQYHLENTSNENQHWEYMRMEQHYYLPMCICRRNIVVPAENASNSLMYIQIFKFCIYLILVELTSLGIHSVTIWMWFCRKNRMLTSQYNILYLLCCNTDEVVLDFTHFSPFIWFHNGFTMLSLWGYQTNWPDSQRVCFVLNVFPLQFLIMQQLASFPGAEPYPL